MWPYILCSHLNGPIVPEYLGPKRKGNSNPLPS
jgi:hypothetical protein